MTISTEKRAKYKTQDPINERLLHEVAKYVYYDTLGCFARDLDITTVEYVKITAPNMFYVNEQIFRVGSTRNLLCFILLFIASFFLVLHNWEHSI